MKKQKSVSRILLNLVISTVSIPFLPIKMLLWAMEPTKGVADQIKEIYG
jgi:hypothetical protein